MQTNKEKKKVIVKGRVVRFIQYSDNRKRTFLPSFWYLWWMQMANTPYEDQLKAKHQQVYDQLSRIGKSTSRIQLLLGSVQTMQYRNKLEFGCSNKRWLTQEDIDSKKTFDNMNAIGFHITGAFDKIYPITQCQLMDDLQNQIETTSMSMLSSKIFLFTI